LTSERVLKLTLEYDGGAYQGWQYQPDVTTLQGEIEARLARILGASHRIHGAGRTDAGVHARGQVAHFHTTHPISVQVLQRALNATLPRDIGVRAVEEVGAGFHARKQAQSKQYAYQILNRETRSVFLERYAWHITHVLDWSAMERVCGILLGEHDFSAFRASDCVAKNPVRRIDRCAIVEGNEGLYRFEIEGSGFLKHMVRTLVGTLVDVGRGKQSPESFEAIMACRDRRQAGRTAPARGLWLEWVAYGGATHALVDE